MKVSTMAPRLEEAQQINIRELGRLVRREVTPVLRPTPWRWMWVSFVVGLLAAATMESCHRDREAEAAWRSQPTADERLLSGDYPLTETDMKSERDRLIVRELRTISGF